MRVFQSVSRRPALASGTEIDSMLNQAAERNWSLDWPRLENTLQELHDCVSDPAADALAPLRAGRLPQLWQCACHDALPAITRWRWGIPVSY